MEYSFQEGDTKQPISFLNELKTQSGKLKNSIISMSVLISSFIPSAMNLTYHHLFLCLSCVYNSFSNNYNQSAVDLSHNFLQNVCFLLNLYIKQILKCARSSCKNDQHNVLFLQVWFSSGEQQAGVQLFLSGSQ